ncbi:KRI1 [Symbiodinium natans]|uniref:KRI1 protein n=1 Tax=Symbiodinium natans TaxID=878477 RepID=A0A812JCW0_9DINO|nr:KRI1 [Symbiodinium natans]
MTAKKGKLGNLIGDGEREEQLSVSQKYAKKYNEKKDKMEAARVAQIFADEDVGNTSEESTEDENADLLTQRVESKIFDTLTKIKAKDPSIYQSDTSFFNDDDFKEFAGTKADNQPATKKMTYKNFIRTTLMQEGADAIAREEEDVEAKKRRKTPAEEQRDLQNEIRKAAGTAAEEGDLFSLKEQSLEERQRQDEEFAKFQSMAERKGDNAEAIMANYWRGDEDLDEKERFLRDYVVNRQWLETDSLQAHGRKDVADFDLEEEEDEHLGQADEFEKEYNFRFEVEEGKQIQGHARFPENSVRDRNDKRKRQRKERADRKEADKVRRAEELKRLKNMKKQEIKRRLQQIREVTGNEDSILGAADLDDDFDPSEHDGTMAKILGEDYDEMEEKLTSKELVRGPDGCNDLDISEAPTEGLRKHWGVGSQAEDSETAAVTQGWDKNTEEEDCDENDEEAVSSKTQPWNDRTLQDLKGAQVETGDAGACCSWHGFAALSDPHAPGSGNMLDEYFQLDYEDLMASWKDIIGGDLPTRFKYRKVEPKDYGIPAHVILSKTGGTHNGHTFPRLQNDRYRLSHSATWSGKELNRMVSIKKFRPYREEDQAKHACMCLQDAHICVHGLFRQAEGNSRGRGRGRAGVGRGRGGRHSKEDTVQ